MQLILFWFLLALPHGTFCLVPVDMTVRVEIIESECNLYRHVIVTPQALRIISNLSLATLQLYFLWTLKICMFNTDQEAVGCLMTGGSFCRFVLFVLQRFFTTVSFSTILDLEVKKKISKISMPIFCCTRKYNKAKFINKTQALKISFLDAFTSVINLAFSSFSWDANVYSTWWW